MLSNVSYIKLFEGYLAFFAALMIVFPHAAGIGVVLLCFMVLYGGIRKELKFEFKLIPFLFVAFYLAYLIGVLYTNNWEEALQYLEYKLSFLIFPLLLSFKLKQGVLEFRKLVLGLVIGVVVTSFIGLVHAVHSYLHGMGYLSFFTGYISTVHHPTYFMIHFVFAMSGALVGYKQKWKGFSLRWIVPFILYGMLMHVLSLSLAGLLFLLILMGIWVVYLIYKKWGKIAAAFTTILTPLCAFLIIVNVPPLEGEWNGAKAYATEYLASPSEFLATREQPISGSEARLILWTASYKQFSEAPWGVGTGNVNDHLSKQLIGLNQPELAKKGLNPHNQFLQTGVEIGVLGLGILLAIILFGVWRGIQTRSWLLSISAACLGFNGLFESILQRQSGVLFFTFWICLLALYNYKSSKPNGTGNEFGLEH